MHFRKIEDKIARSLEFFINVIKLKRALYNLKNLELPGYLDCLVKTTTSQLKRMNRNVPAILKKFLSVKLLP